eukprot:scaffold1832_cov362-Prasinococcus_capsulatus_cf.AAC.8
MPSPPTPKGRRTRERALRCGRPTRAPDMSGPSLLTRGHDSSPRLPRPPARLLLRPACMR